MLAAFPSAPCLPKLVRCPIDEGRVTPFIGKLLVSQVPWRGNFIA